MLPLIDSAAGDAALPLWLVQKDTLPAWLRGQSAQLAKWVEASKFTGAAGQHLLLPGEAGVAGVVAGLPDRFDLWSLAELATLLPAGAYRIFNLPSSADASDAALGWALGAYRYGRYRKPAKEPGPLLVWPDNADRAQVERLAAAIILARDLINTPTNDLGPAELAEAAVQVANRHGAEHSVIVADDLLAQNYPMIHAVGRAASEEHAPRLIDIRWGDESAPKVTLVGKGVCFDSGGLDIKPASGMLLMKKDMGGAAIMLGLAQAVMQAKLPVRLRLLIPAVENAISASAFRPGDVLASRAGLTVEIGNTDAEGRLILADALAEADSENPDLLIDAATLTGAARVALGPDLPAMFTNSDPVASALERLGRSLSDPVWRLPLHEPYRAMIDSRIADINNAGEGGFAGSITAALFLKDFVRQATAWVHLDVYAWNAKSRPGRPAGGEAMTLRALFALLEERYGHGGS